MATEAAPLPDDVEQLKQLVVAQRVELEHLKLLIAKLRRMQFGRSSEKLDRELAQRELQLEELEILQDKILAPVRAARPEPVAAKRQPLPEHLPRESRRYQPSCSCPDCGGEMRQIGEDVAEMLEHVPEQFKVIRIVRPKLACERCERIVQEPAPSRPIVRGVAGPGLLAHILVAKYCDHRMPRTRSPP
jgi:transposase